MKVPETGQSGLQTNRQPAAKTSISPAAKSLASGAEAARLLDRLGIAQGDNALAKVVRIIEQSGSRPAQTLLALRGQTLPVQSDTKLEPGQWVRVARAGNELRLTEALSPNQTSQAKIARQLAQLLPWQHRIDTGLSSLQQTSQSASTGPSLPGTQNLSPAVREVIGQLIRQLPDSTSLSRKGGADTQTTETIRQWIRNSGLFAESRIARGGAQEAQAHDLKLALGKIAATVLQSRGEAPQALNRFTPLTSPDLLKAPLQFPPSGLTAATDSGQSAARENQNPGQILRMLSGMLNRLTVNQLHSQTLTLPSGPEAQTTPSLMMELPWVNDQGQAKTAMLRLDKEDGDSEPSTGKSDENRKVAQWRLTLSIDLDDSGTMTFELALQNQQLSGRIWADQTQTLRDAREALPTLEQRLSDMGLEVKELECRRGRPSAVQTRLEQRLVDVQA